MQGQFLADRQAWQDRASAGPEYYVSVIRSGNLPRQRDDILRALRQTHDVVLVSRTGPASIYAVTPKAK